MWLELVIRHANRIGLGFQRKLDFQIILLRAENDADGRPVVRRLLFWQEAERGGPKEPSPPILAQLVRESAESNKSHRVAASAINSQWRILSSVETLFADPWPAVPQRHRLS